MGTIDTKYHKPHNLNLKTNVWIINHIQFSFFTGKDKQPFKTEECELQEICVCMQLSTLSYSHQRSPQTDQHAQLPRVRFSQQNSNSNFPLLFVAFCSRDFVFISVSTNLNVDKNALCTCETLRPTDKR